MSEIKDAYPLLFIGDSTKIRLLYVMLLVRDNTGPAFLPAETVRRAEAQLSKHKGDYDLVFFNCEHFARWCKYGELESRQVRNAVKGVIIGTAAIATAVVAGALSDKEKTEDRA
jgi:hypothetical protein